MPALLPILSDPTLNEQEISIVEDSSGGFEVDSMLFSIRATLRWIPFELHQLPGPLTALMLALATKLLGSIVASRE